MIFSWLSESHCCCDASIWKSLALLSLKSCCRKTITIIFSFGAFFTSRVVSSVEILIRGSKSILAKVSIFRNRLFIRCVFVISWIKTKFFNEYYNLRSLRTVNSFFKSSLCENIDPGLSSSSNSNSKTKFHSSLDTVFSVDIQWKCFSHPACLSFHIILKTLSWFHNVTHCSQTHQLRLFQNFTLGLFIITFLKTIKTLQRAHQTVVQGYL